MLADPPEVVFLGFGSHGHHGPERYLLPDLWSLHLYPYTASLTANNIRFPIRPGFVSVMPPNLATEYEYPGPSQHLCAHFRIPQTVQSTSVRQKIPAMIDLGAGFGDLFQRLVRLVGEPTQEMRVRARVWDILWEISSLGETDLSALEAPHQAVSYAVAQIELRLGETLSVADLAYEANVSYSYLGRLFRQAYGQTVVSYIRSRRMQRAGHLLRNSTLPVKAIAVAVGIPDLHLFNKTVRDTYGHSPRAVRLSAQLSASERSVNTCS